jgi:glycosyltransferase involved in cell wall biosynthesis
MLSHASFNLSHMKIDDAAAFGRSPGKHVSPALRVVLVSETYRPEINGVAMTLGHLVDGLRARGHCVEVVRPRQAGDDNLHDNDVLSDMLVTGLPIPGYPELRFGLPATAKLKQRWMAKPPDIVHIATQGPLGWSARWAACALDLPVSTSFHTNFDAYSRHYGIGWIKTLIAITLRNFHNGTGATMVPTRSLARDLVANGYCNVSVVSRGIDTRLFNPQRRSNTLRTEWGVRRDELIVAYIGRIAPEKNLDLVFAAFNEVQRARRDAKLVVVGDGPLLHSLKVRYPQHIFTGMQSGEALAAHYASADMFLFPSLTETFGNVTVEALASGLGVVGYDYAAAAELIENGQNGLLAAFDDANGFINNAVALATDCVLLARMRLRACASVSHLDWMQVCDVFTTQLHDLIIRHERKRRIKNPLIDQRRIEN